MFNLGLRGLGSGYMNNTPTVPSYLYNDRTYRTWVAEIALAFYEGRTAEFIFSDLSSQFRDPSRMLIIPMNLTKEIIEETSILYQKEPIYQVVDKKGKVLKEDQKLWEEVQRHSMYHSIMDRVDQLTRLLGTVLVKVSLVNPDTGLLSDPEDENVYIQLDLLFGGTYDVGYSASPYYLTSLDIFFGNAGNNNSKSNAYKGTQVLNSSQIQPYAGLGIDDEYIQEKDINRLGKVDKVYWSNKIHRVIDEERKVYEVENPYNVIPAVPFFNQTPAHLFFLPVDEPLIYANHAINLRLTDLNHIAKFQSYGIPVLKGAERPTNLRQGRPVDDFNVLKGGTAQSRFGGLGAATFGTTGSYRKYDTFGTFGDANSNSNGLGYSWGPETAISVGKDGDFKFAVPGADLTGLIKVIQSMTDVVRISHGLKAKYEDGLPASGFATMMNKLGVMEQNKRRAKLFKEREQQLFQIVKQMWNTHYSKSGDKRFSEDSTLEVTYLQPEFLTDPKTTMETVLMEQKIRETGDLYALSKIYPHMSEAELKELVKKTRKYQEEKTEAEQQRIISYPEVFNSSKDKQSTEEPEVDGLKIDNRMKHSENTSKGMTSDKKE